MDEDCTLGDGLSVPHLCDPKVQHLAKHAYRHMFKEGFLHR